MAKTFLLTLLVFSMGCLAQSGIYRTTDADGNVVFTDTPPADGPAARPIEVQEPNISAPPPEIAPPPKENAEPPQAEAEARSVAITAPGDETTIPKGPGDFGVTASATPPLGAGETLQLLIDGEAHGEPQQAYKWALTNVLRGAHDLSVNLLSADGEVVATSDSVRVYVLRPSIIPQRRALGAAQGGP
ncbi:MAG: DUF4124 domain-containing protein [Halioglobus sp.]|nr:DUF4124 domain-containing protein [Halioglobus sp.]